MSPDHPHLSSTVTLLTALDPARNAVVEACAGSGKTWLLVSRMIRLLLAGVKPGELLAITFTRKAAEEMKDRLYQWLEQLAVADEDEAVDFLAARGLDADAARAALPRARGLFERVLMDPVGPMITTFHGWFFYLLGQAPLTARGPAQILDHSALLEREAWLSFAESLRHRDGQPVAVCFNALLAAFPLDIVRTLLMAFVARRAEWAAWAAGRADPVADCVAQLEHLSGVREADDPVRALHADGVFQAGLREYLQLLECNAKGGKKAAARAGRLAGALDVTEPAAWFAGVCAGLLTQGGQPFSDYTPGKAMDDRMSPAGAARFMSLHAELGARLMATQGQLSDQQAIRLTRWGLTAGLGLLARYQQLKAGRDGLDFTDVETGALHLLSDEVLGPALLSKLDVRWRHLLLDEFQDTNPVQWQILRAWLNAYGADGARPSLFVVGDPKQSIYRFRRAEPRLFEAAGKWLVRDWQALYLPNNLTRRLSPRVAAWVNGVFAALPEYPGFQAHDVSAIDLPGGCELILADLPAEATEETSDAPDELAWRDPLAEPLPEPEERRADEAQRVAARIGELVGRLSVRDGGMDRPARYGDIMVLSATRTGLAVFEAAFKRAGIPFLSSRRGGLLETLEVSDLIALLTWLSTPADDLALAQALKCPVFAWDDRLLQTLAQRSAASWWARLVGWAAEASAPDPVRRAHRLLAGWQAMAGRLPAHDLLDRIFHEGDLEARYLAAAPLHLRPGVRANLHAMLAHSLVLSGGRYPSLPRFIDELKSLRDQAGQDAPDEAPAETGDCVRLMTIHAAKGLEAPVVFLIKADEPDRDHDHYGVLLDWPVAADQPHHVSLFGPQGWRGSARMALFEAEDALRRQERLNLLYVAMTRARQLLVISGLAGAREGSWLDRARRALDGTCLDGLPELMSSTDWPLADMPEAARLSERVPDCPPVGGMRATSGEEAVLGVQVHRYLELVTSGWTAEQMRRDLGCGEVRYRQVQETAEGLRQRPDVARFFDSAAYAWARNEMAYLAADGSLRRIDRVVACEDALWVLDYKTGGLDETDPGRRALPYLAQMQDYMAAMHALYPDQPVRGLLLFADGQAFEVPSIPE